MLMMPRKHAYSSQLLEPWGWTLQSWPWPQDFVWSCSSYPPALSCPAFPGSSSVAGSHFQKTHRAFVHAVPMACRAFFALCPFRMPIIPSWIFFALQISAPDHSCLSQFPLFHTLIDLYFFLIECNCTFITVIILFNICAL